jgi:hypothetical protein
MKEFNLKDLLENNTAVSCKTKKQAKELFKELQILGYIWKGGEKLSAKNTYYSTYKEETCYTIDNTQGIIAYQDITYFKENGYKIIQIKDIIIKKQKIMKRILHFKNPSLTKQEYEVILKTFVEITEEDFDQAEWQEDSVFSFLTDKLEVRLSLSILDELSKEFDSVSLSKSHIYIKNEGVK